MSLIRHLMQGGAYGHYWAKQSKRTIWWSVDEDPPPTPDLNEDLYFGVYPSKVKKGPASRPLSEDAAAVSCLYADIDSKDFGNSKSAAADHVKRLEPKPSAIIDSGGGYHCYWLLDEPFILRSDMQVQIAKSVQRRWVHFVGGDLSVHDLARVLRLPGTLNYKYDPSRPVKVAYQNLERTYSLEELASLLPPEEEHRGDDEAPSIPRVPAPNRLSAQEIVDLAKGSANGKKFVGLWQGDDLDYESASEADLALCCILAFWTGGDYGKIDRLFRASKRMRPKWEREDYRHRTLTAALGQVTQYYQDPGGYTVVPANDEGNARCVAARCRNTHCYCEALGWLHYEEGYWRHETAEASVAQLVMKILKERRIAAIRATGLDEKYREAVVRATKGSAANIRNCIRILRDLVTVSIREFDKSLDELNCLNGVVNLRTGELVPHAPSRRFTYCAPVRYNPEADQSFWTSWLLEAIGGKEDVLKFLKLAVGYSLTGHTREEKMFYIYGPARAGKGVFTETLLHMLGLGKIAVEVGMELFMEKRFSSSVGFSLAGLKAARFIAASESKESWWLDTAQLKRWTGGNLIRCAHKYGKPFSYVPQFKIWLTSNWMLQMDADDTAGWARACVVVFPNSYLGSEDKLLKAKMRTPDVLEGVFAWAVEGAKEWYLTRGRGLKTPEVIKKQTQEARDVLDWVARWVEEEIEVTGADDDRLANAEFYSSYRDWCIESGVSPKKQKALKDSLKRMGHNLPEEPFRKGGKACRGWVGARLRSMSLRTQLRNMSSEEEQG